MKEFGKQEPQLQPCKREGCPINREPMGASTEAAKLLKKHHTTCLKKMELAHQSSVKVMPTEESSMKVMPTEESSVKVMSAGESVQKTTPEQKGQQKSSKPSKISVIKDVEDNAEIITSPIKKKKRKT